MKMGKSWTGTLWTVGKYFQSYVTDIEGLNQNFNVNHIILLVSCGGDDNKHKTDTRE